MKKSKWRFLIYLLLAFEVFFCGFNMFFTCMCGHHEFKVIPITIIILGEIISYIIINIKYPEKLEKKDEVLKLLIIYLIVFIIGSILTKNNMDELHESQWLASIK